MSRAEQSSFRRDMASSRAPVLLALFLALTAVGAINPAPPTPANRFLEDVAEVKVATAAIAEQLRNFNALYVGKLETRMVSMAGSLGALHTNVDRLLERAHVWDTLQLHVAAWTEQMHSLSSKMDLLSRAQEKMSGLESRLSSLPAVDYRLEALGKRLEDTDKKLESLSRDWRESQRDSPIVGQFAARGALSTLRVVERKLDRVSQQLHKCRSGGAVVGERGSGPGGRGDMAAVLEGGAGGKNLVVRCQTNPSVVELLRDVSAKVDVLFDHSASSHDQDADPAERDEEDADEMDDNRLPRFKHSGRLRRRGHIPSSGFASSGDNETTTAPSYTWSGKTTTNDPHTSESDMKSEFESATLGMWAQPKTTTSSPPRPPTILESDMKAEFESTPLDVWSLREPQPNTTTTSSPPTSTISPSATDATLERSGADQSGLCADQVTRALEALTDAVRALDRNSTCPEPMCPPPAAVTAHSRLVLPEGPQAGERPAEPGGCEDLVELRVPSGLYSFQGRNTYCDMTTDGGGWTIIQRRGDWGLPRLNFSRSWADYREGFGSPTREFWIGNKWLHRLSSDRNLTLRVHLWDWDGELAVAEYARFAVDSEEELFRLDLGGYSGNATDSLSAHNGRPFSTWDANHDTAPSCCPCAPAYAAGWWFDSCFSANLNGEFHTHPEENEYYRGIIWEGWRGDYSLRATSMMVRAPNVGQVITSESQTERGE